MMHFAAALLLSLLVFPALSLEQKRISRDKTVSRLHEWPMIYAHDAGTGTMKSSIEKPDEIFVNAAAQTQVGTLVDLANCGARAFDIRPWLKNDGTLVTHHGGYPAPASLKSELEDLLEWNEKRPEEFIYISFSHFDGVSGCGDRFYEMVDDLGLNVASKNQLLTNVMNKWGNVTTPSTITIAEAQALAGGVGIPLLAPSSVWANNWSSNEGWCYKFTTLDEILDFPQMLLDEHEVGDTPDSNPYEKSLVKLAEVAQDVMDAIGSIPVGINCYIQPGISSQRMEQKGKWDEMCEDPSQWLFNDEKPMWKADGHWQYSTEAIVLMFMTGSSILFDSLRSNQNEFVADVIKKGGAKNGLNLVGVDHVCEGGNKIVDAFDSTLFVEESIFTWTDRYFQEYLEGLKAGKIEYTAPSGLVALLLITCCCCCVKRRCDADFAMMKEKEEWEQKPTVRGYAKAFTRQFMSFSWDDRDDRDDKGRKKKMKKVKEQEMRAHTGKEKRIVTHESSSFV